MQTKFTINSTETRYDTLHHQCFFEKALLKEGDYPKILASVNPPIPAYCYHRLSEDLDLIVLAPRLEGSSVYPSISRPCFAYLCIPQKGGNWSEGPWEILDWVEVKTNE